MAALGEAQRKLAEKSRDHEAMRVELEAYKEQASRKQGVGE